MRDVMRHLARCVGTGMTVLVVTACGAGEDDGALEGRATAAGGAGQQAAAVPPGADGAFRQLRESPRHGEWRTIPTGAGDSVRAWVVHPERSDPAPVVLVVHEIYGLTGWIRSVADQLAAEGFLAVAPDLLTGQDVPTDSLGDPERDPAVAAVRGLDADRVHRRLERVAGWAMDLPSTTDTYGIVGFCWGGSTSFAHATRVPELGAAVVYYGSSPEEDALRRVEAPVLGLYGGDDERVNSTIPRAETVLAETGATYETRVFEGAGHGFLRQQDGREGANLEASRGAWPETIEWFRTHLESGG